MKASTLFLCGFILLIFSFCSLWGDETPELWSRALRIADNNYSLVPGSTNISMTTTNDRSGKIIQTSKTELLHYLKDEGEIVTDVISHEVDGEDEDNPENDRMLNNVQQRDLTPNREGIFFQNPDENFTLKPLDLYENIGDFIAQEFEFIYTTTDSNNSEVTFIGSLWLEKESGAPLRQRFSMSKTPLFVREITIERNYHYDNETGLWYLSELNTKAEIRVLLRRMTNIVNISYSDYWEHSSY